MVEMQLLPADMENSFGWLFVDYMDVIKTLATFSPKMLDMSCPSFVPFAHVK